MQAASLFSSQNHVETPFIIVKIGKYTFGHCKKEDKSIFQQTYNIEYPNYMDSLNIVKINGAINTYVLTMTYAITPGDDPNALERVFSSISNSRTITLTYGDWNQPAYIYKDEQAIVTKLTTNVDMDNSRIKYTIHCTSSAALLSSVLTSFPAKKCKPSDEIKRLLSNKSFGLTDIFKGMNGKDPSYFIDGSDKVVQLEAKPSCSVIEYINYLVKSMTWVEDSVTGLKTSCYFWSIFDDTSNKYGGSYFKVVRVSSNTLVTTAYDTYEIDIGYPTDRNVLNFTINNDDSWSLLYNYSNNIEMPKFTYEIDDDGNVVKEDTSMVTLSRRTHAVTQESKNWWSLVTQFPITATVKLKGLLRATILMSYVKINTYFYGKKHISSGIYLITKQEDSISSAGYRTTLTLLRVGEDKQDA